MTRSPVSSVIGWWPAGDRSMIASRRLPSPTPSSTQTPSSSGPRCAITRVIAATTSSATGAPFRLTAPAIPHMGLRERVEDRAQLAHNRSLLVVGHLREERQRDREPVGQDAAREVLGLEVVLVGVEAGEDRRVRALPGRDATVLELGHERVALLAQPVDVVDRRLLRLEQADVRLVAVDALLRNARSLQPFDVAQLVVVDRGAAAALVEDAVRAVHLDLAERPLDVGHAEVE